MTANVRRTALCLVLGLAGCGGGDDRTDDITDDDLSEMTATLEEVGAGSGDEECIAYGLLLEGVTVEEMQDETPGPEVLETYRAVRDDCGSVQEQFDEIDSMIGG